MITFTVDVEDPFERYDSDGRYIAMTRRILDLCDELGRKATFFTVGRVAEAAPQLIRDIAQRGHEVAYHSRNHLSLTDDAPAVFRRETKADKDMLEQLTGTKVVGFRAPRFSLTPDSLWAIDILREIGFLYSSSIMPTEMSLFGFPNALRIPFKWSNGLIELPLPVANVGKRRIPYLGGIYLYALPASLTEKWVKQADPREILWTYTHPYDFDREESFALMPNTPAWVSAVLWVSRRVAEKKIRKVLSLGKAGTLMSRLSAV